MNAGLVIQYLVVALAVMTSGLVALRKLLPNLTNRWLAAASIHFGRKRDSRAAQALSRRLQPKQATSHSCADGCASCNACGPRRPASARPAGKNAPGEPAVLHFHPPSQKNTR